MELKKYLRFVHVISVLFLLNSGVSKAQIIPDNTLPTNSFVSDEGQIKKITNGSQIGKNLFHSFKDFSIPTGTTAYFDNNLNVENIISRVTGNSISNIDGVLRANGSANLFLINPRGIIFGSNATLNIGGSFLGSTASSIQFADGSQFSAVNPSNPPLLTINVPIGLIFESLPGTINVQGNGHSLTPPSEFIPVSGFDDITSLRVSSGKTLALVGGDLVLEGGSLTSENGKIELASVKSGLVSLSSIPSSSLILGYEFNPEFGNIDLSQKASVVVYGVEDNTIELHGNNIRITDGSIILNQNRGTQTSGKLDINALGSLELLGLSQNSQFRSSLISENVGKGKGAELTVSARQIIVSDGGAINTLTYASGAGGKLILTSDNIQVSNVLPINPRFYSNVVTRTFGSGKGGDLSLETKDLFVINGGGIGTVTLASGVGGNITINASNKVQIADFSLFNPISSNISSFSFDQGSAGNLEVITPELIIEDGGAVGSRTFGIGRGGNVFINADFIKLNGVAPITLSPSVLDASTFSSGDAGNLTINTSNLVIQDGGRVDTTTLASGNAGNLTINALNSIEVSGTVPGSINPSLLDSSANILDESLRKLFELPPTPSGNSGNVTINTRQLNVKNGGQVTVRNDGTGDAGQLQISANLIKLDNKAGITASTQTGNGGNININSQNLSLRNNSNISAEAKGIGDGGNIIIESSLILAIPIENSDITANAFEGRGGNINITAQGIFGIESRSRLTPLSDITASSQLGINGTVQINTLDTQIVPTTRFPENIVQPSQITSTCQANSNTKVSTFVNTGTGGIPYNPDNFLPASNTGWYDSSLNVPQSENTVKEPLPTAPVQVVEAQGWLQTPDGTIVLTAESMGSTVASNSLANKGCNQTAATEVQDTLKNHTFK